MNNRLAYQLSSFVSVRIAINTMLRMVYPFLPVFGRGLGVDLGILALAITMRQASGVLGPALASIGDSHGRKTGMLLGLGLFTSGALVLTVWPGFWGFTLMLVLGIMANFVFVPSMQAFLGDRVSYERRGLYIGLSELSWSLALIIGIPLAGIAINNHGWLTPFPWFAGAGVVGIAVLWFLLPDDRPSAASGWRLSSNLRLVIHSIPALAGIALALTMCASNELVNMMFGTWLERSFAVEISVLSAAAIVIGSSELGGELLVSGLVDRIGKHRSVLFGLVFNALALVALLLLGQTLGGALAGLFMVFITFEFVMVGSFPLMTEVLPAARATFISIYIAGTAVGRAIGDLLLPILYNPQRASTSGMGIAPVILTALFFNLLALIALRHIKIQQAEDSQDAVHGAGNSGRSA